MVSAACNSPLLDMTEIKERLYETGQVFEGIPADQAPHCG